MSLVSQVAAADSQRAVEHFSSSFQFETDCWDVHETMKDGQADFVLIDVRGPDAFSKEHIPGAINLPHRKIVASKLREYPPETLFVVYCAGPHCNGAARGALRFAELGRPVKIMSGGMTGWNDEGFSVARGNV